MMRMLFFISWGFFLLELLSAGAFVRRDFYPLGLLSMGLLSAGLLSYTRRRGVNGILITWGGGLENNYD